MPIYFYFLDFHAVVVLSLLLHSKAYLLLAKWIHDLIFYSSYCYLIVSSCDIRLSV